MIIKNTSDLAGIISAERKKQGLTQMELAGVCNVSVRFLISVEKGKETAQIGKVIHIINMLGLKIDIGRHF